MAPRILVKAAPSPLFPHPPPPLDNVSNQVDQRLLSDTQVQFFSFYPLMKPGSRRAKRLPFQLWRNMLGPASPNLPPRFTVPISLVPFLKLFRPSFLIFGCVRQPSNPAALHFQTPFVVTQAPTIAFPLLLYGPFVSSWSILIRGILSGVLL